MKPTRRRRKTEARKARETGIALFMVISALALLSYLVSELTYSTQVQSRMAYNAVDNLKAFYLLKAGYKISLLRLKGYQAVKGFVGKNSNTPAAGMLPKSIMENIWNMPFMFPLPAPKELLRSQIDAIEKFTKESSMPGRFSAVISGEGAKLNLNNLFVKQVTTDPTPGATPTPGPTPTPTPTGAAVEVNFRPVLEETFNAALDIEKRNNREFFETYRNVQGKDIVDAIEGYLLPNVPASNLPGFKLPTKAKNAPLYSVTELHLIPGLDDTLYNLIEPMLTVNTTMGLNVNTVSKQTLQSLLYELTVEQMEQLLKKRDDPDVGKPWNTADDFWKDVDSVYGRDTSTMKKKLQSGNITLVTEELSFRITVNAQAGLSKRQLEAYVIFDGSDKQNTNPAQPGQPNQPGLAPQNQTPPVQNPLPGQNAASNKKPTGLKLIYWRVI